MASIGHDDLKAEILHILNLYMALIKEAVILKCSIVIRNLLFNPHF